MSKIVIALGGNALGNTPEEQLTLVKKAADIIVSIAKDNDVIVTHGNGPQVGMINNAFEYASKFEKAPLIPFAECGAMSQGYIGYHLQNAINEKCTEKNVLKKCATVISQVEVDKTDSRIVKIIKLPYAPCNITYSNGVYTFPSEWTYHAGYMKLNDASLSTEEFLNERFGRVNLPELYVREPATYSPTAPRSISYESKLYHSDFYDFKLVYDSFVRDIKLENFETDMFDPSYV